MKKGLAILFAVLCLLLCACHRDTDTAPEKVTLTNVYSAAPCLLRHRTGDGQ